MRIAVASGKGGAGKTIVTASLATVWDKPFMAVDADVEAPNLHLFLRPRVSSESVVNLEVPVLNNENCTACGACRNICRFKAIAKFGDTMMVFPDMCHSCGGCFAVCPAGALSKGQRELGVMLEGHVFDETKVFLMGRSRVGEAMTPPQLRALQKRQAELQPEAGPDAWALIDSPPGVSCPAMTVAREADLLLLVAEPTPFGLHDFRLAHTAFSELGKPMAVVMNRAGLAGNREGEESLRSYCRKTALPLLAEIPFAREAAEQYAAGGILADLSPDWRAVFLNLRDSITALAEEI